MSKGKIERICEHCGKTFTTHASQIKWRGSKYCSKKCYNEFRKRIFICQYCGKEFTVGQEHKDTKINKYCSHACLSLSQKKRIEKECEQCGKIFEAIPSHMNRKFCSKVCADNAKRGKTYAPRIEKECEICGKIFVVTHPNHRFCSWKCSTFWLTRIRNQGKNHPKYKGNPKNRNHYPPEFFEKRKEVILKYDGKCFICNKNAKSVHHIDYNTENNNIKNLVLLCSSCHAKTNNHREEWIKFFNDENN